MSKRKPPSGTYTIDEAADRLNHISRNSAYAAARRGEIPVIKLGSLLRVPKAKLDRMLGLPGRAEDE
jgi:excisionase family DNA binding protein